jgi:hypothetical protein
VTNRKVGSPIISEAANPAATNETYLVGGFLSRVRGKNMLIVPATLPGQAMGDWCETNFSGKD